MVAAFYLLDLTSKSFIKIMSALPENPDLTMVLDPDGDSFRYLFDLTS
jgi:hypothetical protein